MKPTNFPEQNAVLAEDQPNYLPLPVWIDPNKNETISCWKLSFSERLRLFVWGKLWLRQYTFRQPLQPQLPQVETPFV